VVRQVHRLVDADHQAARDVQQAQVAGDAHVADHAAADEGDLPAVPGGRVHHLLDAVHVGGEGGDDDATAGLGEDRVEHRAELPLGGDEAGDLRVGRVGQQQLHALGAEPGEAGQVGDPPVQRQLVHLEVAGVQHDAGRGLDGDRERVRDRVVDREELAL